MASMQYISPKERRQRLKQSALMPIVTPPAPAGPLSPEQMVADLMKTRPAASTQPVTQTEVKVIEPPPITTLGGLEPATPQPPVVSPNDKPLTYDNIPPLTAGPVVGNRAEEGPMLDIVPALQMPPVDQYRMPPIQPPAQMPGGDIPPPVLRPVPPPVMPGELQSRSMLPAPAVPMAKATGLTPKIAAKGKALQDRIKDIQKGKKVLPFDGYRAGGGIVRPGTRVIVGEDGPEELALDETGVGVVTPVQDPMHAATPTDARGKYGSGVPAIGPQPAPPVDAPQIQTLGGVGPAAAPGNDGLPAITPTMPSPTDIGAPVASTPRIPAESRVAVPQGTGEAVSADGSAVAVGPDHPINAKPTAANMYGLSPKDRLKMRQGELTEEIAKVNSGWNDKKWSKWDKIAAFLQGWATGGIFGGINAARDEHFFERQRKQRQLADLMPEQEYVNKQLRGVVDIENIEQDNATNAERLKQQADLAMLKRKQTFLRGKKFFKNDPRSIEEARLAGIDPSTLNDWDDSSPVVKLVDGTLYERDPRTGEYVAKVEGPKQDWSVQVPIIGPDGNVQSWETRVYKVPVKDAARFDAQMKAAGFSAAAAMARQETQIAANVALQDDRQAFEARVNAARMQFDIAKMQWQVAADQAGERQKYINKKIDEFKKANAASFAGREGELEAKAAELRRILEAATAPQ